MAGGNWTRRGLVSAGVLGVGAVAVYKQAPLFWRQYAKEMFATISKAPHRPNPQAWPDSGLQAAWLGHATCLLKMDGMTILTDPVFSDRCGIDLGLTTLGPKRLVKPALGIDDLPPIDLILLSHAHFDHWDLPSLRRLAKRNIPVLCARETSDLLAGMDWKTVDELGWGERKRVGAVEVKGVEVRHWGARVRRDTHRGYTGYLLEGPSGKILFSGDTAHTEKFQALRGGREIDLAIMPVGAYNPWIANHCTPEEAVQMADWAGARQIMPVHHKTFVLSVEPVDEPIERFQNKTDRGVAGEVGREWVKA